jgi:predicted metal-dependent hydrolase
MIHEIKNKQNTISFLLERKNRKKIAISVYPDKSIKVSAPHTTTLPIINDAVKKRIRWIKKQKYYFEDFLPKQPSRKYVGGETHLYLGRSYRLKVNCKDQTDVKLKGRYIFVPHKNAEKIASELYKWYFSKSENYFDSICENLFEPFRKKNFKKPVIVIKRLKSRWGSYLPLKNKMTLNLELIKAPKECIEYIIMHELCHLKYSSHTNRFYTFLSRLMPDWKKRKNKLENFGLL